jgi:hypothetical protein
VLLVRILSNILPGNAVTIVCGRLVTTARKKLPAVRLLQQRSYSEIVAAC